MKVHWFILIDFPGFNDRFPWLCEGYFKSDWLDEQADLSLHCSDLLYGTFSLNAAEILVFTIKSQSTETDFYRSEQTMQTMQTMQADLIALFKHAVW